jgi:hypothetical protein
MYPEIIAWLLCKLPEKKSCCEENKEGIFPDSQDNQASLTRCSRIRGQGSLATTSWKRRASIGTWER